MRAQAGRLRMHFAIEPDGAADERRREQTQRDVEEISAAKHEGMIRDQMTRIESSNGLAHLPPDAGFAVALGIAPGDPHNIRPIPISLDEPLGIRDDILVIQPTDAKPGE